MRPILFFIIIGVFMISCLTNKNSEMTRYDHYAHIFARINHILEKDNGAFWDHRMYGPIMFVDPVTREIICNQNNQSKNLLKIEEIYTDTLSKEMIIANTAVEWDGDRWTMLLLPLPKKDLDRNNLIIHELFHRIQPDIGFDSLFERSNKHLDSYQGRLLLRLELQALKQAIQSEQNEELAEHIKNALWFRKYRQKTPEIKEAENALELNEGLAEYTGVMLSGRNDDEARAHFVNSIKDFYQNKTFVRSFAYQTVPVYGYLLSKKRPEWQKEITRTTNLSAYFENAFALDAAVVPSMDSILSKDDYGYQAIVMEEEYRKKESAKIYLRFKKMFLGESTLKLYFENMNISFDPTNITPFENYGTVYPNLKITDNWGTLTVENGALLSADWTNVIVTEPNKINNNIVSGEGWVLVLKKGWAIEKNNLSYELKRK